jgi:mono/diheme cytochrome c family protein
MRRALPVLATAAILALLLVRPADTPLSAEPGSSPAKAGGKLQYNRDVRPILAENCFACHGPDSAARKAKLRLDQRDAAVEMEAFVPGKPDESELVKRLFLKDADKELMPPASSHKKLTAVQKETLKQWVKEGAEYEQHWSFIPPKKPAVPAFDGDAKAAAFVKTPIDAFVYAELKKRGLEPAPEADRRTLARRLSLDLTGLPPSPEEVEAFVNDKSPDYYEKFVDRLMAKPQWGEHRGRYWLDYARYADTHGIHFDNYRENWAYRDWVIAAFNRNQKFDQFATEQLAGDLLPNATLDQKVATGFNRSHITTNEGGAINEEYLVLYTRDRTETAGQVFMGLTVGCAVCHDHKFDPITAKDFYSLAAFFNNTTQNAMDGNVKDTPPILFVPAAADREKYAAWEKRKAELAAQVEERKKSARPDFDKWLAGLKAGDAQPPANGLTLHAVFAEGKGDKLALKVNGKDVELTRPKETDWRKGPLGDDQKVLGVKGGNTPEFPAEVGDFDAAKPYSAAAWVQIPNRGQTGAVFGRMDEKDAYRGWDVWLDNDKFAAHLVGQWPKDGLKVISKNTFNPNNWYHVAVTWDGSQKASGLRLYVNGDLQPLDVFANDAFVDPAKFATKIPAASTKTKVPFTLGRRTPAQSLKAVGVHDLRLYERALAANEVGELAAVGRIQGVLSKPADKRDKKEVDELFTWWLTTKDTASKELNAALMAAKQEEVAFRARGTTAPVSNEKPTPPEAFILKRGEYDKRGEKVSAATPLALPPMEKEQPRNRLGLAQWLLSKDHPLTGRVTVNRFWQELFGQGLVRTAGDFGITGELPSHPELLDWMAEEFESHWDVKRFFKMLVTSGTYRQAAVTTKDKLEKDPNNIFLSRGPRFRMDAEMIRDSALAASGLLVPTIGGPSVKPYQPEGVWEAVAMPESNTRKYQRDTGDGLYRRSMYTFWKRAAPPAAMEVLNAPNRETCAVRRERTNTPLQALLTLNDIQYVEAARVLAEKALAASPEEERRIDFVAKRLLSRSFTEKELPIVKGSLAELVKEFAAKPAEAKKLLTVGDHKSDPKLKAEELAAWTMLCNQLMNLDEVLNK